MSVSKFMAMLPLAATACDVPPDKIAIYPGFTYEQMSVLEPGTGEYLRKHGVIRLEQAAVDIVDPTTRRPFLRLPDRVASLSSNARILTMATISSPDGQDWLASGHSLIGTVRAFIDRGWQCRDRANPLEGPVFEASAIALPEGFCVATRTYGRGWTCESPPGWPRASAFFVWGCGAATNDFSFAWGLDLVASGD